MTATDVFRRAGIGLPIFQAPIGSIASPELAAAVCTLSAGPPDQGPRRPPLGRALRAALARLAVWAERRRQRRALLELSDHLLKDLGLSRADALLEGGRPFWRV